MLQTASAAPDYYSGNLSVGRRQHFYERGENIPLIAQGVWQINRGFVQISNIRPKGDESILGWGQPSTFFGIWLTKLESESYQVKAISDVYLRWFSLTEVENSPPLLQQLLAQVVRRARQTEALLAIAGLRRVEDRLHQLLMLLKQELGQPVDGGTRIDIRLTHQHIASAIGTTRVTITRLLGDFQQRGILLIDRDRHIVLCESDSAILR